MAFHSPPRRKQALVWMALSLLLLGMAIGLSFAR